MQNTRSNTHQLRFQRLEKPVLGRLIGVAALSCVGGNVAAQDIVCTPSPFGGANEYEICDLGSLEGDNSTTARGVNADGTVVIGNGHTTAGGRGFRWVEGSGLVDLGTLNGGYTTASGVNADGTVIVGSSSIGSANRAFRWVEGLGMADIGTLAGRNTGATAVNADGTVVVGYSDTGMGGMRAFRWVEGSGMESITGPSSWSSWAYGVNADGTVVVGDSYTGWNVAFRWVEGTGVQILGTLSGGNSSHARGVNADGSVVVGYSYISDSSARAFRWVSGGTSGDPGNLQMENLGTFEGGSFSIANAVNADGTVVVGGSSTGTSSFAFRWVEGVGMQNLGALEGGVYSEAYGVSADGSVVVGQSTSYPDESSFMGIERAFIWRAARAAETDEDTSTDEDPIDDSPASDGTMEDFANLSASVPILGNDSAVTQAEQQFALGQAIGQRGMAQSGQMVMSAQTSAEHTGRNPTTVGARTSSVGAVSFGYGISDTVTLGATISLNGTSLKNNAFDMESGIGAAFWGQYSQGGAARTGLQLQAAVGYMQSEGEIARGRLLTDVVLATGSATLETRAVQASIGHGLQHGDWLITSRFGMAHYSTRRAAYSETDASFNVSYDEMRSSRTVATLGVTGEFDLGLQGRVAIGVGVDHEVSPERPRLSGTSDIPGLTVFDIGSTFTPNRTREYATIGYTHDFGNGSSLSGNLRVGKAVYGRTPSVGVGVSYSMRF